MKLAQKQLKVGIIWSFSLVSPTCFWSFEHSSYSGPFQNPSRDHESAQWQKSKASSQISCVWSSQDSNLRMAMVIWQIYMFNRIHHLGPRDIQRAPCFQVKARTSLWQAKCRIASGNMLKIIGIYWDAIPRYHSCYYTVVMPGATSSDALCSK